MTATNQTLKKVRSEADDILGNSRALSKFCTKYLAQLCFWASGFEDCFKNGKFLMTKMGETEFKVLSLSKDIKYAKKNITVVIQRWDSDFYERYKQHYLTPYLRMTKVIPEDWVEPWASFTLNGVSKKYESLTLQKTAKMQALAKDQPMMMHASEPLGEPQQNFDTLIDRITGYVIKKRHHDPNNFTNLGDDV